MKRYQITHIERHEGEGQEALDAERIGKHYFTEGFAVGRPALLHHEDTENRVLITSPVLSFTDLHDGVELRTRNTTYTLREIKLH